MRYWYVQWRYWNCRTFWPADNIFRTHLCKYFANIFINIFERTITAQKRLHFNGFVQLRRVGKSSGKCCGQFVMLRQNKQANNGNNNDVVINITTPTAASSSSSSPAQQNAAQVCTFLLKYYMLVIITIYKAKKIGFPTMWDVQGFTKIALCCLFISAR